MKRTILVCFILAAAWAANGITWKPAGSASPVLEDAAVRLGLSPMLQDHGWQVCAIGEMTTIPGVGQRQRVELCHSEGGRINTYCLLPGLPVPELNTFCSRISPGSSEFWCGDNVQSLMQYEVIETPAPQEEDTPTPTPTALPTLTSTPTIPTSTPTLLPSATSSGQAEETVVPSATPYYRPQAGGPGNIEVGFGVLMVGMALGSGWWLLRRRRSGEQA